MNRKGRWLIITALSLLMVFAGLGSDSALAATMDLITVQEGELNTRIVLETDALPKLVRTFYTAKAIVFEFDQINPSIRPPAAASDSSLVTGIQLEKTGPEQVRLRVQLQEPVPYTVRSSGNTTVIELNRIQRGQKKISVEPEVLKWLEQSSGSNAFMTKLDVEEKKGQLRFWARLSGDVVSQAFTLENPLRLVVDVYDAVYEAGTSALAVDKFGLRRVRVSQFELNSPRCITRMVFDLNEARYYELHSDRREISVSFFRE